MVLSVGLYILFAALARPRSFGKLLCKLSFRAIFLLRRCHRLILWKIVLRHVWTPLKSAFNSLTAILIYRMHQNVEWFVMIYATKKALLGLYVVHRYTLFVLLSVVYIILSSIFIVTASACWQIFQVPICRCCNPHVLMLRSLKPYQRWWVDCYTAQLLTAFIRNCIITP